MMNETKFDITELQWISLLFGAMVGVGITTLPRELAEEAGRDGWITILVSTAIVLLYAWLCLAYAKRFPTMTLAESTQLVLGKWMGILVIVMYSIYAFTVTGIIIRSFLEIIHVYFEVTAPAWVKSLLPIIIIVYMARCGLATIARMTEIVFILTVPFTFLLLVPIRQGDIMHMLPIFEQGIAPAFTSLPAAIFGFLGVETIILVLYPYLEQKNTSSRVTIMGVTSVGLFYTTLSITTLVVLGLEQSHIFYWPFVEVVKTIRVVIIERIDNLFLYIWTIKVIIVAAIFYFCATFSLSVLTKKKYHDIWALVCWPIIVAVVIYPTDLANLEEVSSIISLRGGIFVVTLPIILFTVAKIRGIKGEQINNKEKRHSKKVS